MTSSALNWGPDVLGPQFERAPITTPDGAEVTLIRHVPSTTGSPRRVAVLYVHGFVDYFFQAHVAEAFSNAGYAFYGVDLRAYGRSMAAHEAAGGAAFFASDLALHAVDLDATAETLRAAGHERIAVIGHSMGGLVTALWALAKPGRADALICNSPWFDLNGSWAERVPLTWLLDVLGRIAPNLPVSGLEPNYTQALHVDFGGEWDFSLDWKPSGGVPVLAGWIRTVRAAHRRLNSGNLRVGALPTVVFSAEKSGSPVGDRATQLTSDTVLNVEHIKRGALAIGAEYRSIANAAHDLALGPEPGRTEYLSQTVSWLRANLTP